MGSGRKRLLERNSPNPAMGDSGESNNKTLRHGPNVPTDSFMFSSSCQEGRKKKKGKKSKERKEAIATPAEQTHNSPLES